MMDTELTIILEGVSGLLTSEAENTFDTVVKEVLQDTLQQSDEGVTVDLLYVQILDQEFFSSGGTSDRKRRNLVEEEVGSLKLDLKVVADVTPGDYTGFTSDISNFFADSGNTEHLAGELRKEDDFFEFVLVSENGSTTSSPVSTEGVTSFPTSGSGGTSIPTSSATSGSSVTGIPTSSPTSGEILESGVPTPSSTTSSPVSAESVTSVPSNDNLLGACEGPCQE